MSWIVLISNRAIKGIQKLPKKVKPIFAALENDLRTKGPYQPDWPNYGKLDENKFHCHLTHSWVVCWQIEDNELQIMEIYYVGSREDAPY